MAQVLSSRNEATDLINDIVLGHGLNAIKEIHSKVIALTKHLFDHQYLLYSSLNKDMESSGILKALIISLDKSHDLSRRDFLRLIHLFLQVNRTLRDRARQNEDFIGFLQNILSNSECWENIQRYKHHINIASELLMDKDVQQFPFNTSTARGLAKKTLINIVNKKKQEDEFIFPSIVFYGCSMHGFFKGNGDEPDAEAVLTKEVTGKCLDILRDYIQDFKLFYTRDEKDNRANMVLYKPKLEFSFQQICATLMHFLNQSEDLRMNIFQSGLYEMINNLFSLEYIPEPLILCGVDFLQLPSLDAKIIKGLKTDYFRIINYKLSVFLNRGTLSGKSRNLLTDLLQLYLRPEEDSFPRPSGEIVRTSLNQESLSMTHIIDESKHTFNEPGLVGVENWNQDDVKKWLSENHLDDLREKFFYLSGMGLIQLRSLVKNEEKMKLILFLMETLRIRFDMTLELISALERL